MLIIRKQRRVLRIFAADRQAEDPFKQPCLLVDPVHDHAVIARVGADQILKILRQIQRARRRIGRMIIIYRGNRLDLSKNGLPFSSRYV